MGGAPDSPLTIRRILVAMDGSDHSLAALDAAMALAEPLRAELDVLFVEDADLLRLSDLPFARVTSLALLEVERTDRARMERHLRLRAARAHEAFRRRTARARVRARFRSVRGEVVQEVLAACAGVDLLGLGKLGHGRVCTARCGSTLRAALAAEQPLLVAEGRVRSGEGLLALYDGSPAAGRALALAQELAAGAHQRLSVVALAGSAPEAQQLAREAEERLSGGAPSADISHSWAGTPAAIAGAVRRLRPALVILGRGRDDAAQERTEQVLQAVSCPTLLVP